MMNISPQGVEHIKSFEFFSPRVYTCPAGYKTIGYGHLLLSTERYTELTSEQADEILYQDITLAEMAVLRLIRVKLTQYQFDMLTSFTFNLGGAALQSSTLRQKINRLEHHLVAKELMRWVYAGGKILPGLLRRRFIEGAIYDHGYV